MMQNCPECSRPIQDSEGPNCPGCFIGHVGYPNVRRARSKVHVDALDQRYRLARSEAEARGAVSRFDQFANATAASQAVVNVERSFLIMLMTTDMPYAAYRAQIVAGTRSRAKGDWDRQRAGVDGILFGTYDHEVRFATLTINRSGLTSYGEYSLVLKEDHIAERTSLLDENSYDFVRRHRLTPLEPIPTGHIAPWEDRGKLATAARASEITMTTIEADFPDILTQSEGQRETDRFVEAHIFGPFSRYTVASIEGPLSGLKKRERAKLMAVKDFLEAAGGTWIDS